MDKSTIRRRTRAGKLGLLGSIAVLSVMGIVSIYAQALRGTPPQPDGHEFYLARVAYPTSRSAGSRPGIYNPMWAVDYPFGEMHFQPALSRMTKISVADVTGDEQYFFELDDDRIFQYPFLWMQQPGSGDWRPTEREAAGLRGVPVVVHHRSLSYLCNWLGLEVVADLEPKPGVEPSAAYTAQLLKQLQARPAAMVLRTAYQSPRASDWIAGQTGTKAVVMPYTVGGSPRASDLFALFDDSLSRLLDAAR